METFDIMSIIHELRIAKGSIAKKKVLKKYTNNEIWKRYLKAVYDDSVNYYITRVEDKTFIKGGFTSEELEEFFGYLSIISSGKIRGNKLKKYSNEISEKYGVMFRLVIARSINASIGLTTINGVYNNLIPEFKVMLAEDDTSYSFPLLGSIKYDGVRLLLFKNKDKCNLILRSGKNIEINSLIEQAKYLHDGVYDGELVSGNGKQRDWCRVVSSVNRILKGNEKDILIDYSFMVFDYMTHEEWDNKNTLHTYIDRYFAINYHIKNARRKFASISNNVFIIKTVEQFEIMNDLEISNKYEYVSSLGFEGLILRYKEDHYFWKRTNRLIKKKAKEECRLLVVDVNEGNGKYECMIGSLVCIGRINEKDIKVNISGLTDEERDKEPEHYIGEHIDVIYNSITQNQKTGEYSLFLPRIKRIGRIYDV